LLSHKDLTEKLKEIENRYDKKFKDVYQAINFLLQKNKQEDVYQAINFLLQKNKQEKEQTGRRRIGFKTGS
jgi:hypothetical protein